jgi:hypothetical protein
MPAGIGDNSKLTPAEQRALYFHHFSKISGQRAIVKAAQAIEKTLRKQAKADGLKLAHIDYGMYVNNIDDETIIVEDLVRRNEIARWMGVPVGTQSAFNFKKDSATTREGYAAGLRAAERKSPYPPSSFEDNDWLSAFDEAQKEQLEAFGAAMEKRQQQRTEAASSGEEEVDTAEDEASETQH